MPTFSGSTQMISPINISPPVALTQTQTQIQVRSQEQAEPKSFNSPGLRDAANLLKRIASGAAYERNPPTLDIGASHDLNVNSVEWNLSKSYLKKMNIDSSYVQPTSSSTQASQNNSPISNTIEIDANAKHHHHLPLVSDINSFYSLSKQDLPVGNNVNSIDSQSFPPILEFSKYHPQVTNLTENGTHHNSQITDAVYNLQSLAKTQSNLDINTESSSKKS